jgi:glycosyltransferase involved in cell wall biosynthesis
VRIVHLSDCYLPRLGGIEMQVRDLARRQLAAGHEVHVITTTPGAPGLTGPAEDDGADGVQVHRLAFPLPYELPVNPRANAGVRRVLSEHSFDVAHVHAGAGPCRFGVYSDLPGKNKSQLFWTSDPGWNIRQR